MTTYLSHQRGLYPWGNTQGMGTGVGSWPTNGGAIYAAYPTTLGSINPAGFAASAGGMLASAGISAGIQVALDGINQWISSARLRGGQKIATTEIVNDVEYHLKAINAAYAASPQPHTKTNQQAALSAVDALFDFLRGPNGCGNMQYGSAGQRCVDERLPADPTHGDGSVYPYYAWYRNPIANDSTVVDDTMTQTRTQTANPNPSPDPQNQNQGLLASGIAALATANGAASVLAPADFTPLLWGLGALAGLYIIAEAF